VAQSEIVHAFLEGTTCRDLVHELGRSPPVDSNELFDIATSFASSEEAVGAIFPTVENVFLIFRGPTVDMSNS
jgi:hypothetical protein